MEYALRAAVFLANNPDSSWTAQEIAEKTQVPSDYLSKIMRTLGRSRIVTSRPGRRGGYGLARDADRVTLLEIVDAVDPIEIVDKCPLGDPCHAVELCPLHRALKRATLEFTNTLGSISLQSLCSEASKKKRAGVKLKLVPAQATGRGR